MIDMDLERLRRSLTSGAHVDVRLTGGGRLYVDRPLPFVCLYRTRDEAPDDGSQRLVTTQPSYAVASGAPAHHAELVATLRALSESMIEAFGRFLVLEIWCRSRDKKSADPYDLQPDFRIFVSPFDGLEEPVEALEEGLKRITIQHFTAQAQVIRTDEPPPGMDGLGDLPRNEGMSAIGLEIEPVFRRVDGSGVYPFLFDDIRAQLADALRRAFFAFAQTARGFQAPGHLALGRRALEPVVGEVDEGLSAVDESFDFLLQITPINAGSAWSDFKKGHCQTEPVFRYRPLPIDPTLLKRRLYALPVERVEDPSLRWIFREKQEELDRQITMLSDRESRRFFFESLQLYGEVSGSLLHEARDLLAQLPETDYDLDSADHLDAEAFAEVAAAELTHYRRDCPEFPETVHIRHDLPPGLLVSEGRLLIGHRTRVPAGRVEALLHHEIGTHMLTYFNGRVQPLRLLYNGLARYASLQEGLAVLAEYLVGGLNVPRLRVLAARVVAAHCMIEGSSFVDLYRLLRRDHRFESNEAFSIALRTFRGGGLIKDVIYLRGLHEVMHHLQEGGSLEALFVGKMGLHHLPVLDELRARGILREVPLTPRYLFDQRVAARLDGVREGSTFIDLIEHRAA